MWFIIIATTLRHWFYRLYLETKQQRISWLAKRRQYPDWHPPRVRTRTLYFREQGGLSIDLPAVQAAFDEHIGDPTQPVSVIGYVPLPTFGLVPPDSMTADQRIAARRLDVLVDQTEPLEHFRFS